MNHPVYKSPEKYICEKSSQESVRQKTSSRHKILLPTRTRLHQEQYPQTEHGEKIETEPVETSQPQQP